MRFKISHFSFIAAITLFAGCNGSNNSSSSISGTAIDGYISGATICADINNNGSCDSDEPSTTTRSDGTFTLGGNGVEDATLILKGGTDVGTGLTFEGQLTAPAGSKTVTPLTTMIQTLVSEGDSLENAENTVKTNLGISNNIDLKNYDPIAVVKENPNDINAKKVLEEQTKIQILISVINSAIVGLSEDENSTKYIDTTFNNITKNLKDNKDLSDTTVIETLINDISEEALPDTSKTSLNSVSNDIAQKLSETINLTSTQMSQSEDDAILDKINATLNVAQSEISKAVKESSKTGNSSNISSINLKDKIDEVYTEISKLDTLYSVKFDSIPVPLTEETQNNIQTTDAITINGEKQNIDFKILKSTGDSDNNEIFGLVKDYQDNPISFSDGSQYICNGTNSGVGSGLDFSSIIQKNDKIYMISQFECSIGAMYMYELEQDSTTGELSPKENTLQYISQKSEFGGFTHCAGMLTPWKSHLSSEEYEPDAKTVIAGGNEYYDEVNKYWGGDSTKNNPYYYGWTPEVKISDNGTPEYTKHYSMGRFSHELSYVMPDSKTIYMTDDGTNVGLYMYIADNAEDLTSGTLYAAKLTQEKAYKGGKFSLNWIDLGHATDAEIKTTLQNKPKFTDIFDETELNSDGTCAEGYTGINTTNGAECLKVKDGMEKIASRLETRRYSAIMGATTELRKEEGITYDPIHNKLYVAISEITQGMEDNKKYGVENTSYDKAGNNHIKLPYNACGGIYALDLQADSSLNSNFIAQNFYAILVGEAKDYEGTDYEGNTCDIDNISSPDNVTFIQNSNQLIIGEDTSAHKNNVVWAYNVETKNLDRIMSVPIGAEATSTDWYQKIGDFSYQTLVTQHPSSNSKESSIGILGPIAKLNKKVELNTDPMDIATPDYSIPGAGDIEGKLPDCYTSGEGLVYKSNFECRSLLPWSTYSTASDADWEVSSYGGTYYAYISGYGANEAANDWLISPRFDLKGDEILTFKSAKGYSGPDLKLLISEDYSGSGDPEDATWTELNATWASTENGNYQWTSSGDIDLSAYAGKSVYFAFRQVAEGTASGEVANWEIDNFIVKGSGSVYVEFTSSVTASKTENITTLTELTFTPTISGGEKPYTYSWTFDSTNSSTEESPVFTFTTAGEYNVTLTVTDNSGETTNSTIKLTVSEPLDEAVPEKVGDLRIATFNSYLNRSSLGALKAELDAGTNSQIKNVAEIIQRVNPDILMLQEFDYYGTEQVETFINDYLKVAQKSDTKAVDYPYYYTATVNTGTQPDTPVDFDNDGKTGGPGDAYGFGEFEGQYGMVVLSKYPIDTTNIRTFQKFLWKDMPNAYLPKNTDGSDFYSTEELNIFRLSSKSHWDIPVNVNGNIVHVLGSHPTPPTFDDGDIDGTNNDETNEVVDWNGKRNYDEIRLWADYIANTADYLYDDNSTTGGLEDNTRFVILGDQNSDEDEGDSFKASIKQLLTSDKVNAPTPTSKGALDDSLDADDTANWGLRADYVLPSNYGFKINQSAVFWPRNNDVKHPLIEKTGSTENSSDHRLVWTDLSFIDGNANETSVTTIDESFDGSLGDWNAISVTSDSNWAASSYSGETFAKINGYGADTASNDWLISPKIEFTGKQVLTFESAKAYNGPDLTVKISTDFDGTNVDTATWTELTATMANTDSGNYTWLSSGDIDLSSYSGEGYIAFHYTSTGTASGEAATWEVKNVKLAEPLPTTLNESFNGSLGDWDAISVTSNKNWAASSYSGDTFAKINGYGADTTSNDWLISPKIEFTGKQVLTFESAKAYNGPDLTVKISTDFDGTNVDTATWTELTATMANTDSGNYTWLASGDIDLSSYSGEGYIAFHYTSTGTASGEAATWEVKNIVLAENDSSSNTSGGETGSSSSLDIVISEIADPKNNSNEANYRFVELYNPTDDSIDLSNYKLVLYSNGNTTANSSVPLSGTLEASAFFVIANNATDFNTIYGVEADMTSASVINSNGDDTFVLTNLNDEVIDIFGEIGVDGTGTAHEFKDGVALRTTYIPRTTWTSSDWTISSTLDAPDGFSPGVKKKLSSELEEYYSSALNLTGTQLKDALHAIVKNNQTAITYAQAYVYLETLDADPSNSNNVLLLYTNRSQDATSTKCNVTNDGNCWNREHVWPKSLGVGTNESKYAYTDLIHLRAADMSVNSSRGNKIFGIVGTSGTENSEATGNYYNSTTWEPRDAIKGDIARIAFYMATRYEGTDSESDLEFNTIGDICVLLSWHEKDPVDANEIKRNELVYSYQHNRNPFVDKESFAQSIWANDCE